MDELRKEEFNSVADGRGEKQKQILHFAYPMDKCPWGPKTLRSRMTLQLRARLWVGGETG